MSFRLIIILVLIVPTVVHSQHKVWIKVEKGAVFYLSPLESDWVPVSEKEKIPVKTCLMTKDSIIASIFKETTVYRLPSNSYFFVDDIFDRERMEIVAALTRIEAEQLPQNMREPDEESVKTIGLIYGKPQIELKRGDEILYETERVNAIRWFVIQGNHSAALLSLKRMVTRYPQAYLNREYVDQLFTLYSWFGFYGFLLEESKLLLTIQNSEAYNKTMRNWYDFAQAKLLAKQRE